jgi:hypothetical protein
MQPIRVGSKVLNMKFASQVRQLVALLQSKQFGVQGWQKLFPMRV